MSNATDGQSPMDDDAKVGQLVGDFTQDVSALIRDEMALAKVEISESVKKAGLGAGLFGVAGITALYGIGALVATAILALALVMDAWLAALLVTVLLFAIAGAAALVGQKEISAATPPLEATKQGVHQDIETIKGGHA